ncbi:SDR family NAD(P)-dependent oxidoreductase [Agrobacterium tumefaciens]|uniref:SDR family oxidoreductase n=1 Tax=Agrobacterium tumefaciens TaxID=358 RepID=UPI0012B8E278|nr:SDR family oxidoreductase [Agrobacterium tumefaciens]MQB04420.1 SDR family NAD(P)-dependent oxidoreductase [Agrobacterium tumefaciens]
MSNTSNKVAIVTGASRGIGAAIAERLSGEGFTVVVNYSGSAAPAEALVRKIETNGGAAISAQADVSDPKAVAKMFDSAETAFGHVDVLVNNAGILKTLPLAETSDDEFDRHFAINAKGTFNTMREAAKRLQAGGRIINFSSTTLALNMPGYAVYNGTKAAVEAFTHVFAKELRGRDITVNAVAPGPIATDLFLTGKSDELIAQFAKMPPLERLGQPADIANVVSFLAGPDAGWVNGQIIRANGGVA